ncbi:MAG: AAA family ATPase [Nitrospira sp.]|nr:AAA family ATPase [Nitrospira sp.]MCP9442459.1 AAA family ATPase [Nitrospira sp.]
MNTPSDLTFTDYLDIARRRKWMILVTVVGCLAASAALYEVLPKTYRSTTTILLEGSKIPENYVKTGVEGKVDSRLYAVQQIVMSRTLLAKIGEQFGLITPQMSSFERESVVQGMRQRTQVTKMRLGHLKGQDTTEGFTLSFDHTDPVIAMKVAEALAAQFIEQDLKLREQVLEGASEFLDQELRLAEAKLEEQEQAISAFRAKYMGELPQQMEANLRTLDRLQMDVIAARENVQAAKNKVELLEQRIKEASLAAAQGVIQPTTSSQGQPHGGDPLLTRLAELERNLTALSTEYHDNYPDIILLRKEIDAVKAQLALKYGVAKEEVQQGSPKLVDPIVLDLMRQRDEAVKDLEARQERLRRLLEQVKDYEGRVERTPMREQELSVLVRDYDNMQKNYQALLDKRLNARLAENLEKRQKGEQFRILDPANLPITPESPKQYMILLGGLVVGCGLGGGAAFALELFRPAFRRVEQVEGLLGVPILAGIPSFATLIGAGKKSLTGPAPAIEEKKRSRLLGYLKRGRDRELATPQVGENLIPSAISWNLVAKWWPDSMISEQYRVAATRLALMSREHDHPVALVTSSVLGEGKSTTTVNLGYTFAHALDKRTLIIDCDFKRPSVSRYLGKPYAPGLSDYWSGTCSIEACIHQIEEGPLWVLPAGTESHRVFELSKVRELEQLLDQLKPRFDQIFLDTPPVFPLADLNFLSRLADVMVFVIMAGKTGRDVVETAFKALRPQCKVGIILAGVESTSMPYYHYYHHSEERPVPRYAARR